MNRRTFKLEPVCPYTRVEYLENIGWSQVFLPIYPKAGDIIEIESELQFTSVEERQAELTNQHPYFFWGVFDDSPVHFYAGIAYNLQSVEHPADTNWHIFKLVSYGENAGFWIDGINYYPGVPTAQAYAPTGFQLWRNLNSTRRCLNRKKWLRITINGRVVMNLLPVLDDNGVPAFYDTISGTCFYNSGEDELIFGPVISAPGYTPLEYIESSEGRLNALGAHLELPVNYDALADTLTMETLQAVDYSSGAQAEGSNRAPFLLFYGARSTGVTYFGKENASVSGGAIVYDGPSLPEGYVQFKLLATPSSFSVYLNDELIRIFESVETESNRCAITSLTVFGAGAHKTPNCSDYPFNGKKKYFKLWLNEKLVYHLIPVLDSVGTPCMYDIIHKRFHYHVGEHEFLAGPIIDT